MIKHGSNADHVIHFLRRALNAYLSPADAITNVSDVDTNIEEKPCFWVEIGGEDVIIECSLWVRENDSRT